MKTGQPFHLFGIISAACLAIIGMGRFISDMFTDASTDWFKALDGTILRYLVRAPTDGTLAGDLNVQYFKVLAVPCAIAGLYLAHRFLSTDLRQADHKWRSIFYRLFYVFGLLGMFTIMEIEKSSHLIGLRMAGLLPGENIWLNHGLHLISAFLGWFYMGWLRIIPGDKSKFPA
ncbi:MAG: hypothetical protein WC980_08940 [Candidatus Brocadiia bacterium]